LLILINIITLRDSFSQEFVDYDSRITALLEMIANEREDEKKDIINDTLMIVFKEFLSQDIELLDNLNDIRYLGNFMSADSVIRMFTWNIPYTDGENRYINFICHKTGSKERTYKADNNKGLEGISSVDIIEADDWYGTLYYDILPFVKDSDTLYILLGIDFNNMFINSKVIEVMHIDKQGNMMFGEPCIINGEEVITRMVFRYSSGASMMLRFDEERERIIFDHLVPSELIFTGQYQYYGPDFSYDALILKDGFWSLTEDVELRNKEK
jgi:hypothetical protein